MAKRKPKHRQKGVASVLELAKWKPGDIPYFVIARPIISQNTVLTEEDQWAFSGSVHPKTLYEFRIIRGVWNERQLPRLHATDFESIVGLLTSELMVEPFEIVEIYRCTDTGEFIYCNEDEEWMPESCLFSTITEAKRERTRIKTMIRDWTKKIPQDLV